jgi:hypothetical protein
MAPKALKFMAGDQFMPQMFLERMKGTWYLIEWEAWW